MGSSQIRVWLQAARPKTLWAAVAPVLMGTAMAWEEGVLHPVSAAAALVFAVLIQVGTNLCNDYADFRKGADTEERQGPVRVTQAGLVSPSAVLRATFLVFGLASLVGLYLVSRVGWGYLYVVAFAVLFGVMYTAGPFALGYQGLGDVFVLIFFGPVAVAGTHFVQAQSFSWLAAAVGLGPGLLSVAVLVVNNLRDAESDARAGKRTLVVRFGRPFGKGEYAACLLGALALPLVLPGVAPARPFSLLVLLLLPLAFTMIRRIRRAAEPREFAPFLACTARFLLLYSLLFSVGWVL
jgi:1,4-dihydroxy-2-naphthoate octaprenyltransferase